MLAEPGGSEASEFLAAEQGEDDGAVRTRSGAKHAGEFKHGGGARGVVVCAVVDAVAVDGFSFAEVVEMCGEQHGRRGKRAMAAQNADRVPSVGGLDR